MTDTEPTEPTEPDVARDRARDGLDHLQTAARELIQAARAALDVAERLIDDPEVVSTMVGAAGKLGGLLRTAHSDHSRRSTEDDDSGEGESSPSDPSAPSVERIVIR